VRVLQHFTIGAAAGAELSVSFSRFPNGGGVIDRVVRISWIFDEVEQRRDVTAELTPKQTREIERKAAQKWDRYWTCDPRTAREWVAWSDARAGETGQEVGDG
jgi:hypothetical protein